LILQLPITEALAEVTLTLHLIFLVRQLLRQDAAIVIPAARKVLPG
jgi:hypothetical protein